MKQPIPTNSAAMEYAASQCRPGTPALIVEAVAGQVQRMRECKARIDIEGVVVRDMKGSVIPHPAIKIEKEACEMVHTLMQRWGNSK
jgi:hypothetical protein